MDYQFFYDGISLKNKRETNMDSLLMCLQEIQGEKIGLFLLCDGVGGTVYGGDAAQFVTQELGDWFFSQQKSKHLGISLSQKVFSVNKELLRWLGIKEGATTLSALLLTPRLASFCHVGDSRIYQSKKNIADPWALRTEDHVNDKGELLQYLGKSSHLSIDFWEEPLEKGQFLLCTDGFYRKLDWEKGATALGMVTQQTTKDTLKTMAQEVIDKGERDNCSALLITVK